MLNLLVGQVQSVSVIWCLQPVNKSAGRIAPVTGPLSGARRDPRLARRQPPPQRPPPATAHTTPTTAATTIAPNVFDIKPLHRPAKRSAVITIEVATDSRRKDRKETRTKIENGNGDSVHTYIDRLRIPDPKKINKLPPIPKIRRDRDDPPSKKKKELRERKKRRDKDGSASSSPDKKRGKDKDKKVYNKERMDVDDQQYAPETVSFKELKNFNKKHYMRRNKEKSESPERLDKEEKKTSEEATSKISLFRMRG